MKNNVIIPHRIYSANARGENKDLMELAEIVTVGQLDPQRTSSGHAHVWLKKIN
jgi:hypothetical protein